MKCKNCEKRQYNILTIKRKLVGLLTAVILVFTMTITTTPALAADTNQYSSEKAMAYAKSHWNDGKGDCVAFVRACVQAGGIPKESWRTYGYSAKEYVDYLVKNGLAEKHILDTDYYYADYQGIRASDNVGKIAAGDIILYHCNNKKCAKRDFHVSLAAGSNGTNEGKYPGWITCYAHNKAVNNKVACKIKCSKCGAEKNSITMYSVHFKSEANGYYGYIGKATGLKSASLSGSRISVSWKKTASADGYRVYRSTKKSGVYKKVGETTKLSFKNTVPTAGKTYYYKIRPYKNVDGKKCMGLYSAPVSGRAKK